MFLSLSKGVVHISFSLESQSAITQQFIVDSVLLLYPRFVQCPHEVVLIKMQSHSSPFNLDLPSLQIFFNAAC